MTQDVLKGLVLLGIYLLFFLLQTGGVFVFWGIGLNLLLVFSVWIGFLNLKNPLFFFLLVATVLISWWWSPLWIVSLLVFPLLSILTKVLRSRLTGNVFLDFIILVAGGTILLFWALSPYSAFSSITFDVFYELLLNLIFGAILWISPGSNLIHHAKTTRTF